MNMLMIIVTMYPKVLYLILFAIKYNIEHKKALLRNQ